MIRIIFCWYSFVTLYLHVHVKLIWFYWQFNTAFHQKKVLFIMPVLLIILVVCFRFSSGCHCISISNVAHSRVNEQSRLLSHTQFFPCLRDVSGSYWKKKYGILVTQVALQKSMYCLVHWFVLNFCPKVIPATYLRHYLDFCCAFLSGQTWNFLIQVNLNQVH